jgi:hypothetical protein
MMLTLTSARKDVANFGPRCSFSTLIRDAEECCHPICPSERLSNAMHSYFVVFDRFSSNPSLFPPRSTRSGDLGTMASKFRWIRQSESIWRAFEPKKAFRATNPIHCNTNRPRMRKATMAGSSERVVGNHGSSSSAACACKEKFACVCCTHASPKGMRPTGQSDDT